MVLFIDISSCGCCYILYLCALYSLGIEILLITLQHEVSEVQSAPEMFQSLSCQGRPWVPTCRARPQEVPQLLIRSCDEHRSAQHPRSPRCPPLSHKTQAPALSTLPTATFQGLPPLFCSKAWLWGIPGKSEGGLHALTKASGCIYLPRRQVPTLHVWPSSFHPSRAGGMTSHNQCWEHIVG